MATSSVNSTSPFAALVNPALVQAAAARAALLDLPKHRSAPWAIRDAEGDDDDGIEAPELN
jgi:hypothetical protein